MKWLIRYSYHGFWLRFEAKILVLVSSQMNTSPHVPIQKYALLVYPKISRYAQAAYMRS